MNIYNNFSLTDVLWYKIGGKAKYYIEVSSKQDVLDAVLFIDKNNIERVFILGDGSNLLFSDDYFDGAVIRFLAPQTNGITLMSDGLIEAFAGVPLDSIIQFGFAQSLTGLEWAGGLPGTVGAAIRGNVGAFGGEIKDVTASAEVWLLNDSNRFKTVSKEELAFGYRSSLVKTQKLLVVTAEFALKKATEEQLQEAKKVYQEHIDYRSSHHPLEYPNCGSVFKNIHNKEDVEKILRVFPDIKEKVDTSWHGKVAMGYVIKRLGFAGYRIGNAQVSEKHSNFIVNLGGAKAADVKIIIATLQEKFFQECGFLPEVEVEIVE